MSHELNSEIPRLPVNSGGRKTKFNRTLVRRVLRCLEKGLPISIAASASGIQPSTLLAYRRRYPAFDEKVKAAISKGIEARLDVVVKAMKSDDEGVRLRAATWWLSHAPYAREHFSESTHVEIEAIGQIGFVVPRETLDRIAEARREHDRELNGNGSQVLTDSSTRP